MTVWGVCIQGNVRQFGEHKHCIKAKILLILLGFLFLYLSLLPHNCTPCYISITNLSSSSLLVSLYSTRVCFLIASRLSFFWDLEGVGWGLVVSVGLCDGGVPVKDKVSASWGCPRVFMVRCSSATLDWTPCDTCRLCRLDVQLSSIGAAVRVPRSSAEGVAEMLLTGSPVLCPGCREWVSYMV
ncbi:hypothetical protein FKM82_022421 [Ascaphus truei]